MKTEHMILLAGVAALAYVVLRSQAATVVVTPGASAANGYNGVTVGGFFSNLALRPYQSSYDANGFFVPSSGVDYMP